MSNKTQEEKLRILQERLTQIKEKETASKKIVQTDKISSNKTNNLQKENPTISFRWLKYLIILVLIGYVSWYVYNNTTFEYIKSEKIISSENSNNESNKKTIDYSLNLKGNSIAIIATFNEESSAKALVSDLIVKGYKADYFFLPYNSNSSEEV